jgi:hypothetical protein
MQNRKQFPYRLRNAFNYLGEATSVLRDIQVHGDLCPKPALQKKKKLKDYEIRTGVSGVSGGSHGNIPGGLRSA